MERTMPPKILKKCECGAYTMREDACPRCGESTLHTAHPPKYSLHDKYGKYRREHLRKTGTYPPREIPGES